MDTLPIAGPTSADALYWLKNHHWPDGVREYGVNWLLDAIPSLCTDYVRGDTMMTCATSHGHAKVDGMELVDAIREWIDEYQQKRDRVQEGVGGTEFEAVLAADNGGDAVPEVGAC